MFPLPSILPRSIGVLLAMTSASHAEGRQFNPGQAYLTIRLLESATVRGTEGL